MCTEKRSQTNSFVGVKSINLAYCFLLFFIALQWVYSENKNHAIISCLRTTRAYVCGCEGRVTTKSHQK
jgi:hypothetical protein